MSETMNKLINDDYKFSESDLLINLFIIRKEEIDIIMDCYKTCCLNYNEDCEFIKCSDCCLLGMFGFCVHVPYENAAHIYIRKLNHYINRSKGIMEDTIEYINHETLHGIICHIGEKDAGKKYDLVKTQKDATFDYDKALELEKRLLANNENV